MATIIIKPMLRFVANTSLMPEIHICQVLETFGPSRQTSKTDAALTKVKLQIYVPVLTRISPKFMDIYSELATQHDVCKFIGQYVCS